jgi:hypothetical protein
LAARREVAVLSVLKKQLFNDIIRFEIELWNAPDARLKTESKLLLSYFEPCGRTSSCRAAY